MSRGCAETKELACAVQAAVCPKQYVRIAHAACYPVHCRTGHHAKIVKECKLHYEHVLHLCWAMIGSDPKAATTIHNTIYKCLAERSSRSTKAGKRTVLAQSTHQTHHISGFGLKFKQIVCKSHICSCIIGHTCCILLRVIFLLTLSNLSSSHIPQQTAAHSHIIQDPCQPKSFTY